MYYNGMLNSRHTGMVGKWGNTQECNEGFFAIHRSNHMEAQLNMTDEVTGNIEQLKVEFNHGKILSAEGSPIQIALESVEHVNKAELKYFLLHEDVQSVCYKDDVYV